MTLIQDLITQNSNRIECLQMKSLVSLWVPLFVCIQTLNSCAIRRLLINIPVGNSPTAAYSQAVLQFAMVIISHNLNIKTMQEKCIRVVAKLGKQCGKFKTNQNEDRGDPLPFCYSADIKGLINGPFFCSNLYFIQLNVLKTKNQHL